MDYKLPHIFEPDGSKGVNDEPLCKCGLNNTYSIHDPKLVKEYFPNIPPSAQTEWRKEFDEKFVEEAKIEGNGWGFRFKSSIHPVHVIDFIRKLLASERTRLLSVESMKEVHSRAMCNPRNKVGCVCEHKQENALRQSILSEMEKGE